MFKKLLLPTAVIASMSLSQLSFAAEQCKSDKDCKEGQVCILALNPPVCKPPQPAGEPCKRDVVCASKKCEIPSGKDVGICK
jgi:Cys-rich repeat protein